MYTFRDSCDFTIDVNNKIILIKLKWWRKKRGNVKIGGESGVVEEEGGIT